MDRKLGRTQSKRSRQRSHPAPWRQVPIGLRIFGAHEVVVLLCTLIPYAYASVPYTHHNQTFPHEAHFLFQWDTLWFINIAHYGYGHVPHVPYLVSTAFFPWLPILIHVFGVWASWILTQGAFALALWRVPVLLRELGFTHKRVLWATGLLAFNPAMVYDAMLYAEPWTLLFVVVSIEMGLHSRWGWAALAGFLASTTQATGLLVGIFPLVINGIGLFQHKWQDVRGAILWGFGPIVGTASYALYLSMAFHQPMVFATIQHTSFWHAQWQWPWLQWIHAWRVGVVHPIFWALALCMTILMIGSIALVVGSSTKNGYTLALMAYGCLGMVVAASFATSTEPYHSSLRIASIFFPLYLGIAHLPRRPLTLIFGIFAGLGITSVVLVSHGWWYQ